MGTKKIAAYYRLSVEDNEFKEESNSITTQRMLIKRFIAEHSDLEEMDFCEFYDDGVSGTTMNRPGMQNMLQAIKSDEIGCVIVKDISRFSRDYIELGSYMEQIFPFMGVRFIAITDHYDSKDYTGKTAGIDIGFKSLLSDFYCKDVSSKVKSSLSAKKNRGQYATGSTPFGYAKAENDRNQLVIMCEEASVVRQIFELADAGDNLVEICRILNDKQILTPLEFRNKRKKQNRKELLQERKYWQPGTVRSILTNESYIGSMVYGKSERVEVGSNRKVLKPRKEWHIFKDHHEAIVTADLYWSVQKRYSKESQVRRKTIELPLKGKMICSYCRRNLKFVKTGARRQMIYCPNHMLNSQNGCIKDYMDYDTVERIVLHTIQKQMSELTAMDIVYRDLADRIKADISECERQIKELAREFDDIKEEKLKALQDYHEGNCTKEGYLNKRKSLDQIMLETKRRESEEVKRLAEMEKKSKESPINCGTLQKFAGMKQLTKEMAESFIEKIVVQEDRTLDIYWTFNDTFCAESL